MNVNCMLKNALSRCLHITLVVTTVMAIQATPLSASEPLCRSLMASRDPVRIRAVAKPPAGRFFREPAFGTRVIRISDTGVGDAIYPPLGIQAWNTDESLLLLLDYQNSGLVRVVDGSGYQAVQQLRLPLGGEAKADLHWSAERSDAFFFIAGEGDQAGWLMSHQMADEQSTPLHDFGAQCREQGFEASTLRLFKGLASDKHFYARCANGENQLLLHWNNETKSASHRKVASKSADATTLPAPSRDGSLIWFENHIYNDSFSEVVANVDVGDLAATASASTNDLGSPVIYLTTDKAAPRACRGDIWGGIGLLVEYEMEDGACRSLVSPTEGYAPEDSELFLSATSTVEPHRVAYSSTNVQKNMQYRSSSTAPLLFGEIFVVDQDTPKNLVCRLAHHRSYAESANNAKQYPAALGKPNPTLSPSGTRVIFTSDWYDSGSVDTYVVETPRYALFDLSGRWLDLGNANIVTDIKQTGTTLEFNRNAKLVDGTLAFETTATGTLSGSEVSFEYETRFAKGTSSSGKCRGAVADDGATFTLQCDDLIYGEFSTALGRDR